MLYILSSWDLGIRSALGTILRKSSLRPVQTCSSSMDLRASGLANGFKVAPIRAWLWILMNFNDVRYGPIELDCDSDRLRFEWIGVLLIFIEWVGGYVEQVWPFRHVFFVPMLHFAMSSRSQSGLSHSQSNLRFSEFASDFPTYLDSPHGALSGDWL